MKYLVTFICHIINEETIKRYNIIKHGLPEGYDIVFCSPTYLKSDMEDFVCLNLKDCFWKHIKCHIRNELCYIGIYDKYPEYDKYYFIEYDVIFNKNNTIDKWRTFFNKYDEKNIDLLCTHYNKYNRSYNLAVWKYVFLRRIEKCEVDVNLLYFGFLPICMLSNSLLKDIKLYYSNNDDSFFEYLIPSLATYKNYNIYCIDDDYIQTDKNIIDSAHHKINHGSVSWYQEDKSVYDDNILIHPVKLE